MAFIGTSFIFDGIPSEMFGLMVADIGSSKQSAGSLGGKAKIYEDRIALRAAGLDYGAYYNEPLSFPIVFTVSDGGRRLDRYEIASISGWLTGHAGFKELVICQPDMEGIKYRCRITNLETNEVGMKPVGFTATVTCDGPYAYKVMSDDVIQCNGTTSYTYRNYSNVNGYYRPVMEIACTGPDVTITNQTDGNVFKLIGMTARSRTITIDCLNQVMTSSDGINLYQYWNTDADKQFPQFLRGDNKLSILGATIVTIKNEFPWNIGN